MSLSPLRDRARYASSCRAGNTAIFFDIVTNRARHVCGFDNGQIGKIFLGFIFFAVVVVVAFQMLCKNSE